MPTVPVLIITDNHFDPTWRRCWDRRFTFRGQSFVSYAEIEDYYLTDNLALAAAHPEYKFEAESALVVRKYVERHPERLPELRALAQAGRFAVTGAGDNIIDTNMVLGESFVRNMLLGLLWVETHLGITAKLGVRTDGFGNSAQVPQIFRGCEIAWVSGLSYSPASGKYWRGLDGSTVCHAELPVVSNVNVWTKYAPHATCHGNGCVACDFRGIDPDQRNPLPSPIDAARLTGAPAGRVSLMTEELLPNPAIIAWAQEQDAQFEMRFAIAEEQYPFVQSWIAQVDNPPAQEIHPGVELNPNNAGVWVTRIKTKQTCRRQEYALLGAEALCALASLCGATYPRATLTHTWQTLLFTMFHDAITATHIDAAYAELQDMWGEIDTGVASLRAEALAALVTPEEGTLSVLNPTGNATSQLVSVVVDAPSQDIALTDATGAPVAITRCEPRADGRLALDFVARDVAPLSATHYQLATVARPESAVRTLPRPFIENARYRVVADAHGIRTIVDKRLNREIARDSAYRVNEMILERDEGSPWATTHPDQTRVPLAECTRLEAAEAGSGYQRLVFAGEAPERNRAGQGVLYDFRTTVTLYEGIDRVDFVTEARWDAYNCRIRVAMPLSAPGAGIYGIPYGMLQRDAYTPNFYDWTAANGDWPAVDWAGVQADGVSVALLNKGLPSYTLENGCMLLLSLLRSPAVPTYLHEPRSYVMTDFDGMRDAGTHRFEYAITSYDTPFVESTVVADAESYNASLLVAPGRATLPAVPRLESDNVRLAALKVSEHGNALILRLHEYRGHPGDATLTLPNATTAVRTNLLERRDTPLPIQDGKVTLTLRPWEIATVRVR